MHTASTIGLLRSLRVTGVPRYYEPVRPFPSHRYSVPSWGHHSERSLGIDGKVPTFRIRACAELTPPLCRPSLGQPVGPPPELVPTVTAPLVSTTPGSFDTSSAVHLRSSSQRPPNGLESAFSDSFTTQDIVPEQQPVVWTQSLPPESEGPPLISNTAHSRVV